MEIISLTKLNDDQWQKYFRMTQEILRRHYPDKYKDGGSWKECRDNWLKNYGLSTENKYDEHVILENGSATAWVDHAIDRGIAGFGFESVHDEIPNIVLEEVLRVVYNFISENNVNDVFHWTFSERRTNAMKKLNCEVHDEIILSRLERERMHTEFYQRTADECNINGYMIEFYNEVPEELIDKYIALKNEVFEEISDLNPTGARLPLSQKSDWVQRVEIEKSRGTIMNMFMLLDSNGDIGALCSLFADSYNKQTLRHNGGLTLVSKEHRGKGLGKYLKAKMYLKVLEENKDFKYITTDTMPWNKHMYKINEQFGFNPFKHGYEFKLSKEFLENYLK